MEFEPLRRFLIKFNYQKKFFFKYIWWDLNIACLTRKGQGGLI